MRFLVKFSKAVFHLSSGLTSSQLGATEYPSLLQFFNVKLSFSELLVLIRYCQTQHLKPHAHILAQLHIHQIYPH